METADCFLSLYRQGRNLNGLSQAVGYGDDAAAATNYPLVRIRHIASGKLSYCKTFDHSTMAVATGTTIESTNFAVPLGIEEGASEICLVANGISSPCCPIEVEQFRLPWPIFDEAIVAYLIGSLADGPLWVLGPHGPIPVDPWGPKYAKQALAARQQMIGAVRALQRLGTELNGNRKKIANAVPLAPDEDSEQEELDKKTNKKRK